MQPYRQGYDWEDAAATGIAGLCLVVAIVVAAFLMTILIILTRELIRVYQSRATQPTLVARILWVALALLLGVWLVAGLLLTHAATTGLGAYSAAWAFLLFVVVVEGADVYAGRYDLDEPELGTLDSLPPPPSLEALGEDSAAVTTQAA